MRKKVIISVILIIIALLVAFAVKNLKYEQSNENSASAEEDTESEKTVEELKTETGATASEDIYEIQQEYDGREILTIKPNEQYNTVLAGILKNGKPSIQEIKQLDLSKFKKGIWISEVSRDKVLQILKNCKLENFDIDKEGYLYKKEDSTNEYSIKLENLINSNELTIIDITGTCYIRDEMTGEVVEYPFKDMDLYQICERYNTEGSSIIIITTNPVKEIDILKAICN